MCSTVGPMFPWYNFHMPSYVVETPQQRYFAKVERGILSRVPYYVPDSAGKIFIITTRDVWDLYGGRLRRGLTDRAHEVLFFPGGEQNKRLAAVETLAEEMIAAGGDRSSIVVAFGGGIVNDVGGFVASIFMRGIPVIQVPTTLLAQVDAAVGGKTGVNLASGKNLVGRFHQPHCVLIDPDVLASLPEREYRAGLYEVIKCGVIRSSWLFNLMSKEAKSILAHEPRVVESMIAECVRIKAEVVSADEKEGDLRRILNFGHTVGHALEAETGYTRFLHGEAVAFGMNAAVHLANLLDMLSPDECLSVLETVRLYGPIPPLLGISADALVARLQQDKKTVKGRVHFVLPEKIGRVRVVSDVDEELVLSAVRSALK